MSTFEERLERILIDCPNDTCYDDTRICKKHCIFCGEDKLKDNELCWRCYTMSLTSESS